jgi:uncharacterized phage-like protein YoqJ
VKLAVTGHRELSNVQYVHAQLKQFFHDTKAELLYQGMAAGVDQQAALAALQSGIPYVAVRPWAGHRAGKYYDAVLTQAQEVVTLDESTKYPGPWVYHNRNHYMVDKADVLVSVWDGSNKGGTFECTSYAMKMKKPIWHIHPVTCESGWLVLESYDARDFL